MNMTMMAVVMFTAMVAGFIQAVSGFGGALIMMMALPFFLVMKTSTALSGAICIPMCIAIAWRYRSEVKIKLVIFPTVIYLVSSAIFIRVAANINLDGLKAVFGIFLILLAAYFNFVSGSFKLKADYPTAFVCAAVSGLTGGMFGISGPFLVLYYLAVTGEKEEYLGTINFVFAITEIYSAFIRYCNGLITPDLAPILLGGFITVVLGQFLGSRVVNAIDGEKMKKVIYLMLALSGLITFLRAINLM